MTLSSRSALACAGLGLVLAASAPALALAAAPLAATALALPVESPHYIDIDLAGWVSYGRVGQPNNTTVAFDIGAGTAVTGFAYAGLSFVSSSYGLDGTSWLSDLTLSVNPTNGDSTTQFMDWSPSDIDEGGSATGLSGSWAGASGRPGSFGAGGAFTVEDGLILVTVYDAFDEPFGDDGSVLDTTITAGTLRVFLAPVPEPGTYGMMALGLLAVGAARRKRPSSR